MPKPPTRPPHDDDAITWLRFFEAAQAEGMGCGCGDPDCAIGMKACTHCGAERLGIRVLRNRPELQVVCFGCRGLVATFALDRGSAPPAAA